MSYLITSDSRNYIQKETDCEHISEIEERLGSRNYKSERQNIIHCKSPRK